MAVNVIEIMAGHSATKDLDIKLKIDGHTSLMVRSDQNRIE